MMPWTRAVLLLLCAGALASCAYFALGAPLRRASELSMGESHWVNRIRAVGAGAAYDEFARSVATSSPRLQHKAAHVFGGALYDAEPLTGLSICDTRFNYACFHEFIGRAIASRGLSEVLPLDRACAALPRSQALACEHGIGHGIVAYVGYSFDGLSAALDVCRRLPGSDPIGGCYGGAFMEYNLQTMLGDDAVVRDPGDNWLYPCDALAGPYRDACAYWQPDWWDWVQKKADHYATTTPFVMARYVHMGQRCALYGEPRLTRTCFEGIGNIVGSDGEFDPAYIRNLCEAATADESYRLICKSVAANSLGSGGGGRRGDGSAICAGLTGESSAYCLSYARGDASARFPLQ